MIANEKRPQTVRDRGTVRLDRHYFRAQAAEALFTFVAPLSGLYAAVSGRNAKALASTEDKGDGKPVKDITKAPRKLSAAKRKTSR